MQNCGIIKGRGSVDVTPEIQEAKAIFKENPKYEASRKCMLEREFGGRWRFNEIVGYIRL
jgi:hypothetical protein